MSAPAPPPPGGLPDLLHWGADGLVPVVVQARATRQVLLVGSMSREALTRTLAEGRLWLWSRSRACLWLKGETSGNFQQVDEIYVNCELTSLLVEVTSLGPICHHGPTTCFYRRADGAGHLTPALAPLGVGPAAAEPPRH